MFYKREHAGLWSLRRGMDHYSSHMNVPKLTIYFESIQSDHVPTLIERKLTW